MVKSEGHEPDDTARQVALLCVSVGWIRLVFGEYCRARVQSHNRADSKSQFLAIEQSDAHACAFFKRTDTG